MSSASFAFESFPLLNTPRLCLRQLKLQDSESIFRIFSNERVVEFYDLERFTSRAQAVELINRQHDRFQRRQGLRWGIAHKPADNIIGTCGLYLKDPHRAEVGYDLDWVHWRQGFMSEALREVLRFGFERMELNRIQAHVMMGNIASDRLLGKLGFEEEGRLREYAFFKGEFHDLKSLSLLRRDYSS